MGCSDTVLFRAHRKKFRGNIAENTVLFYYVVKCQIDLKMLCVSLFLASNRVRKSNCVKEVEKIQQRRIERRAAHQLIREQHEQEYDTSVPKHPWEFSVMIRCSIRERIVSCVSVNKKA